jgi:hypothetical protein
MVSSEKGGTEAERTSGGNGYIETIKSIAGGVVNPSFADDQFPSNMGEN